MHAHQYSKEPHVLYKPQSEIHIILLDLAGWWRGVEVYPKLVK